MKTLTYKLDDWDNCKDLIIQKLFKYLLQVKYKVKYRLTYLYMKNEFQSIVRKMKKEKNVACTFCFSE